MATTTNFGWETPDDTDLVKDGALAIRTLGSAIDTSLVDLKGGTTGQVLSKASNTDMDFSWVAVDPLTILDAKGDLISATAADTPARLAVGTNGQVLTADSTTATGLKWATPAAGGKVLQVVQATTSSATVISSTTYTDTGVTASITPSATSSKVLVIVSVQFQIESNQSSGYGAGTKLLRGATTILDNSSSSIGVFMLEAGNSPNGRIGKRGYYTQAYLDSPSTTSSTTYKVQAAANTTAGTSFFQAQGNACVSSIILMEIGA